MKLAFVVQRYGAGIAGGSEGHCRELAERLSPRHDITVLTTCAKDYVTWENAFPAGPATENGVRVIRFPVARQRRIKVFADLNDEVFDALVLLAAGAASPEAIARGWAAVQELQRDMHESRRIRLARLQFTTAESDALSALHTRNFM